MSTEHGKKVKEALDIAKRSVCPGIKDNIGRYKCTCM